MKIQAPLSGHIVPLARVPDDVFSQKMVGDGVAIDPISSVLVSPIDGVVEFIHPSKHAVTIKAADQTEVLMHIGIDTVNLKGEGFKSFVHAGQKVKMGDPLIEFDLDFIATQAKSVMTLVLVTQNDKYSFNFSSASSVMAKTSTLFETSPKTSEKSKTANVAPVLAVSDMLTCLNTTGLHARPAAAISQAAQKFQSEIHLFKNNQPANAKSVTSILTLSVAFQDILTIEAYGSDAQAAVQELSQLVKNLAKEKHTPAVVSTPVAPRSSNKNEIHGVMAAPGQVFGKIYQAQSQTLTVEKNTTPVNTETQNKKLSTAVSQARADIQRTIEKLHSPGDLDKRTIYQAHLELLNDPEIFTQATAFIIGGASAEYAWQESVNQLKITFKSLKNAVMAERIHDLHDVGQRVLKILLGIQTEENLKFSSNEPVILVARHLNPSDMAHLDAKIVKGLCTVEGGASSHVAIIARSMGLAMITAVDEKILEIPNNTSGILYAHKGYLNIQPSAQEIEKTQIEIEKQNKRHRADFETAQQPAITADGHRIEVFANIGKHTEAAEALKNGAEGVGLLRSEFLFLERTTAPTEQEQTTKYQEIITDLRSQNGYLPVIIRTLDVGGDKPLSYLPMPSEENPFLGVRGLRLSLKSPDMFRVQLKALLQVKPLSALKIMFPMVTTLSELFEAKQILKEECALAQVSNISVGIMIEVPSAALMAETFAPHVDFFSIGSNDLTQYTMAIDRGHRDLAAMADGLHPSVLKLIKITCEAAQKHQKMVGVCGGIASDSHAIPLLIGLGVHELSVSVPTIPHVKAQIRKLNQSECAVLAQKALGLAEASHVREIVQHLV